MKDLGYLENAFKLLGNIDSHSNTIYTREYFAKPKKIPIQRGTIQEDTLSPYLFIIFFEPMLRWLQKREYGYTFEHLKPQSTL